MDSVSRRLLVAVAALSLVAVCAVGQDYMVRLNSNMENAIAAECVEKGGAENPVPNPSWYLNGAGIGESMCLNTTGTLDANRLLFTITPDCEGYLQCSAGFRSSLPKRVYGKLLSYSALIHSSCIGALLFEKPQQTETALLP